MALSAQVVDDQRTCVLKNVVILVGNGDVGSSNGFVVICHLFHPLIVQCLDLNITAGSKVVNQISEYQSKDKFLSACSKGFKNVCCD